MFYRSIRFFITVEYESRQIFLTFFTVIANRKNSVDDFDLTVDFSPLRRLV